MITRRRPVDGVFGYVAIALLCALLSPPAAHLADAVEPSNSKLSVHLIGSYTTGTSQIVAAHPRVLKILDVHGSMMAAARAYKASTPKGIVVVRIYTQRRYALQDDPAVSANDFATTVLLPALNSFSQADRKLIDYVEGPNEGDSTPTWNSLQEASWFNSFWVALAPMIADAGFKPCAFSISVGNPPGTTSYVHQVLDRIVPALRVCKQRGGAWSYHPYTLSWSKDTSYQYYYSLRHRYFYSYFAQAYPDLNTLPMLLTEGGFDQSGNPQTSGWQAHGTAAQYEDWLSWWDQQIRQDSYVLGCSLFQIGSPGTWPSFDCEPIAPWLAGYLLQNAPTAIERLPATLTRYVQVGQNAESQSFTVTNSGGASGSSLSYSISENASWLTVNPAAGTSTGEIDTVAVNYTTAALAAGTYTATISITAANAVNSPQTIAVTMNVVQPAIPGDFNGDRHVDYLDLIEFQSCITGADSGPLAAGCQPGDIDYDGDVDASDFGFLQLCFTGPSEFGNPNCAN